jgi:hypothetical protein
MKITTGFDNRFVTVLKTPHRFHFHPALRPL